MKKVISILLALFVMSTQLLVSADTGDISKGLKTTQEQYADLISVAIEKSEYEEEQIDKDHIFIVEYTSPLPMRKSVEAIWLYVALPIVGTSDISYVHFDKGEYVMAITNFTALEGIESPYGDKLQQYIDNNNLSQPTKITNVWVGERVHVFAYKVTCDNNEYIIPYYFTEESLFNLTKAEECNIELGKAYTLDDFLTICEKEAELFAEYRKSEREQQNKENSYTYVDNEGEVVVNTPEKEQETVNTNKINDDEEKLGDGTPAHVYTFEELTGLSRDDIDHISICSGENGIYYSTTYDKVITEVYDAINTKSFSVDINDDASDAFDYRVLFFDSKDMPYNMAYTYDIPHGIVIKEKDGLTYRTSNEKEFKEVVEKAYNLIADIETEETSTFEELTGLCAENVEKVSVACSKDDRTEFSTMSPYVISNIFYDFKDIKFIDDTRDGSAGGWIYGINFYMKDGTYIQFGARIHIDKADYIAIDYNKTIDKMAYYHDLMKNIDCSDWAFDYILECTERGFLDGITDISYKEPITREKFCEIIYNMLDKTMDIRWQKASPNPFRDTFNEKVFSLCYEGIINGKGGYTFAPNDYLTREEAATIIVRVVNRFMPEISVTQKYFNYEDINDVSQWASDSVQVISNLGVMNGIGNNKFAPQDTYTAEQAIATVIRLCNKK